MTHLVKAFTPEGQADRQSAGRKIAAMRIAEIGRLRATTGSRRVAGNLTDAIRAVVEPVGGIDLDLPGRSGYREPPRFDGPDYEP